MYRKRKSIEELQLIAWHNLINDRTISTYDYIDGIEWREYINPVLLAKPFARL